VVGDRGGDAGKDCFQENFLNGFKQSDGAEASERSLIGVFRFWDEHHQRFVPICWSDSASKRIFKDRVEIFGYSGVAEVPYSEGGWAGRFICAARAKGGFNVVFCDLIADVSHEIVGVGECFKVFQPISGDFQL
jgi:hypothetical protein